MKILLLLLTMPLVAFGQMTEVDSFTFDNGLKYSKGDQIILGTPADSSNEFMYVYFYKGLAGKKNRLPAADTSILTVKKIQKHGDGTNSHYVLILTNDHNDKYHCDIQDAVASGEIAGKEAFVNGLRYVFTIDDIPLKDGAPYYEEIVKVGDEYNKEQVYKAAKVSLLKFFKNAEEAIQYQDKSDGDIIAKGATRHYNERMSFTFEVSTKDGKYRIRVYDQQTEVLQTASYIGTARVGTTGWKDVSFSGHYLEAKKGRRFSINVLRDFHLENMGLIDRFKSLMQEQLSNNASDNDW